MQFSSAFLQFLQSAMQFLHFFGLHLPYFLQVSAIIPKFRIPGHQILQPFLPVLHFCQFLHFCISAATQTHFCIAASSACLPFCTAQSPEPTEPRAHRAQSPGPTEPRARRAQSPQSPEPTEPRATEPRAHRYLPTHTMRARTRPATSVKVSLELGVVLFEAGTPAAGTPAARSGHSRKVTATTQAASGRPPAGSVDKAA